MEVRDNEKKSKLCAETAPAVKKGIANSRPKLWITLVCIISILLSVSADLNPTTKNIRRHSSDEFTNYEIITPTLQYGRNERNIDDTRLENGLHANEIILRYTHDDKDMTIDLKLNENLIHVGHFMRSQLPNGTHAVQRFTKKDIDLCHYKGKIRNNPASHVAISTCYGIKGVVFDGEETYFIDAKHEGNVSDEHYLYRRSDMVQNFMKTSGFCKNDDLDDDVMNDLQIDRFRHKRSVDEIVHGPYNAKGDSTFVELVLVVDNAIYQNFDKNLTQVHAHCKDIMNIVNAMYVPLNIFIALVGVVVWNEGNEIEISSNGTETLNKFLEYNQNDLIIDHPNDVAYLLTKQKFDENILGLAYMGAICFSGQSGGIASDYSLTVGIVAATVAHEIGHNFGMDHDTDDCKCEGKHCMMHPKDARVIIFEWSSCSLDQLFLSFENGLVYCLWNKPTQLFGNAECGNGFVEPGEQCDCGLPDYCESSCCNPTTCMLHSNASCATGECCDLTTCHLSTAGTVCREVDGDCDLPEYCTGESEYCPQDYLKPDAEWCEGGRAYCYEGVCRSHDDQCKLLWGPTGESAPDECYVQNLDGEYYGNCGFDSWTYTFQNCSEEDIFCGLLQCKSVNDSLQSGMGLTLYKGTTAPDGCQSVIFDRNEQYSNPGFSPNGAICGKGKMCVHQKCVSVESVRASGGTSSILNDGSGLVRIIYNTMFLGVISLFLVV